MKRLIKNKKNCLILLAFVLCLAAWPAWASYQVDFPLPNMNSSTVSDPAAYIRSFFIFGLILAGFLAVGAIVFGGITYLLAGTTITSVEKAKKIIGGAITGLLLLLCSYLLLYTIDPTLTDLSPFQLTQLPKAPVTVQQTAADCNPATQTWSPSQGKCVAKPAGFGTAQCSKDSPTCAGEPACVPGGCAVAFQQWNQSKCCCINLSSGLCD